MPLDAIFNHINSIINKFKQWDSFKVPYPRVRRYLEISVRNHVNGLQIIKNVLSKAVIKRATEIQKQMEKNGNKISVDDIIRRYWFRQVTQVYQLVERFNFDFENQVSGPIPFEIYYWLQVPLDEFEVDKPFVLQASNQFTNKSFHESIIDPLSPLIEVSQDYIGTLQTVDTSDILQGYPVSEGYIVSYIRGEAKNVLLWPILLHEIFHVIDRERKITESLHKKEYAIPMLNENKDINFRWIREIIADIFSAKYFGPMYLPALIDYFERLPYVQTVDHPEMAVRIKAVKHYLDTTQSCYTDIFERCRASCYEMVGSKVENILKSANLPKEKEEDIVKIYEIISTELNSLGMKTFIQSLRDYVTQAENKRNKYVFTDPLYTFSEIVDLVMKDGISLAIDPNILLNVIIANYERYLPDEHIEVIKDSFLKWRIKEAWNDHFEEANISQ